MKPKPGEMLAATVAFVSQTPPPPERTVREMLAAFTTAYAEYGAAIEVLKAHQAITVNRGDVRDT